MKLTKFKYHHDYGHDWYVRLLFTKRLALFQGSVLWSEYPVWPMVQIQLGMSGFISILVQAHKFGLSIGLLERTWQL